MKGTLAMKLGMGIAGVLLAGTAFAQAPSAAGGPGGGFGEHRPPFERAMGGMGEHGRWWNNPQVVDRLKLTDTQRKAMDDTLQQHRETLVDLRGSLQKAELELEPMMKQDQPNESEILAQIDKVAQARAELEKANARFLLAIRSKLTPDQWKQMEADRASRPQRDWGRGGPGGGPGGQARPDWQRRGQPPSADGQGAPPPPPPGGPQSRMDEAPRPDAPPPSQDAVGAMQ
ncbi:MAG: periplasmic heavy metal sensor [Terracidiphilus sp.]|jgi:Spy/CpxP family protein refolding chaperone